MKIDRFGGLRGHGGRTIIFRMDGTGTDEIDRIGIWAWAEDGEGDILAYCLL